MKRAESKAPGSGWTDEQAADMLGSAQCEQQAAGSAGEEAADIPGGSGVPLAEV